MWKCVDPELEWQIRCFPYGERSDVPRLQQVGKKPSDGRGISDYMYKSTRPQVKNLFPTRPLVKCGRLTWKLSSSLY